ncbi:hypothetical protein [Deinococcus sp. Leaf326]|uniref:hypothetical protein n=1 Tax=Deinococcus sp. Leaf326 TaxID=1736338 RepID=UPI0006F97248|nr:hypothetical protein [Deinococcus sp. Leaf326]KQR40680.1 hypothetical protein ASF71_00480 [Deinococcus sp. Leaf326]
MPVNWKAALEQVRAARPPGPGCGAGPQPGSLRWLEAELGRRGGNPAALRNIVYRDTGRPADKAHLADILRELAAGAGLTLDLDVPGVAAPLPDELELLGRAKKRVYKGFLAALRAGRAPRMVVAGRAGAGKTVLLDHLSRALEQSGVLVTRLGLSGEVGDVLALAPVAGRSFAALAERQRAALLAVAPARGAWLVRLAGELRFAGDPPRGPGGEVVTPGAWAAALLLAAPPGVAVLLALEDARGWPPDLAPVTELRPPTQAEAQAYLMEKLGLPRTAAGALARETGRNLDRLTLLAGAEAARGPEGETGPEPAGAAGLADPDVCRLAAAFAALDAAWPDQVGGRPHPGAALDAALGGALAQLPLHARAHARPVPGRPGEWQAASSLRALQPRLAPAALETARLRLAGSAPEVPGAYRVGALVAGGDWAGLRAWLLGTPDDAQFLPPWWPVVRAGSPPHGREALARLVVSHYAGRGEYGHPQARDALFLLLASGEEGVRAWARVKLAESRLDAGDPETAAAQLAGPEVRLALSAQAPADLWTLSAQADALLVQGALARWRGDLAAATCAVHDPRTARSGARALLWRGLIAKDAGRWAEALADLRAVPDHSPLLSARARYQEGDLRLRLGQPAAARALLLEVAGRLEQAGAPPEEQARSLARAATALRRLGQPAGAMRLLERALALVPAAPPGSPGSGGADGVVRARLLSEGVPVLLALNRHGDALAQVAGALDLLGASGARRAEAAYRVRRTVYRAALAYLTRGLGRRYQHPLLGAGRDHPDLAHARTLLGGLLRETGGAGDREQVLTFDLHLALALAEPDPEAALGHADRALAMTDHPYAGAQAHAARAEASLRAGRSGAVLADVNRAHALLRRVGTDLGDRPTAHADPGLYAQLLTLEACALVGAPDTAGPDAAPPASSEVTLALDWLRAELRPPELAPFREAVWREVGAALERGGRAQTVVPAAPWPLRPGDVLTVLEGRREPVLAAGAAQDAGDTPC